MKAKYVFDTTALLYFARLKQFELLAQILREMPADIVIPSAVGEEVARKLRDFANEGTLSITYASQVRKEIQSLTDSQILHSVKLKSSETAVRSFAAEVQKKLSYSPFELRFDFGEAYAIFLAREIDASTIFSDDNVVPFVVNYVRPNMRVEGSPYLVKYGFLKKLVNYSAFVRLLFDLQGKAGYKFLNLYDPRKRRIFEMYRDNMLDGIHLVKHEIADYVREGQYQEIISRLDGNSMLMGENS